MFISSIKGQPKDKGGSVFLYVSKGELLASLKGKLGQIAMAKFEGSAETYIVIPGISARHA